MEKLRVALLQMKVKDDKNKNLAKAKKFIEKAVNKRAKLIMLPEMFNCPYDNNKFSEYAEEERGESWKFLSSIAREKEIYLVGGSIPEKDKENNIYNTSYVFNKKGEQIAKHRKVHLFDIDIEGGQTFKESDTLSAGNTITTFDTIFGKMGLVICYDLRFPELSALLSKKDINIILVPGAFNMTTGPAHWELLFRSRALDNQVYTIGTAPARDENQSYISYGNSIVVSPWGKVLKRLGGEEDILIADLDLDYLDKIREELPLLKHKRYDLYTLKNNQTDKELSEMSLEELWELFPIILKEHNSDYKNWYIKEKENLQKILDKDKIFRINHIGSTAVEGLIAKPTVDILLEIEKDYNPDILKTSLKNNDWILMHENDSKDLDLVFNKGYTPQGFAEKVFHLHVRTPGDWDELYFRDYLIKHNDIAQKYAELKKSLEKKYKHDRDSYTEAKTDFIKKWTKEARKEFGNRYNIIN